MPKRWSSSSLKTSRFFATLRMTESLGKVIVCAVAVFAVMLSIAPCFAQTNPDVGSNRDLNPNDEYKAVLSELFQIRAKNSLARYIPEQDFEVEADVTVKNVNQSYMPYLPGSTSSPALRSLPFRKLRTYVTNVNVTVLISERVKEKHKAFIQKMLTKALLLSVSAGDRVNFDSLGERPDLGAGGREEVGLVKQQLSAAEQELEKLRAELSKAETNLQLKESALFVAQKERNDFRADLKQYEQRYNDALKERDDLKTEVLNTKQQVSQLSVELQKAAQGGGQSFDLVDYLKSHIVEITLGTLFLLVIFLGVRSFGLASKIMGGAVSEIAKSVETASTNMLEPMSSSTEQKEAATQSRERTEHAVSSQQQSEALQKRLQDLQEELTQDLDHDKLSIITRHVSHLLSQPSRVAWGVATLELLGTDIAKEIFSKLNIEAQEAILSFLSQPEYERPKSEMMLEAGETLKTRLISGSLPTSRVPLDGQIFEKLAFLSDDDVTASMIDMNPGLLPRFLLYLDPNKLGSYLSKINDSNPSKFEAISQALVKMPEAEQQKDYDGEIDTVLSKRIERVKHDSYRPYFSRYRTIIESVDDQVGEVIVSSLAQNEQLANFLQDHILTISMFFDLEQNLQDNLLGGFSNKEIAALYTSFEEDKRDLILRTIPERRVPMVQEEIERMSEQPLLQTNLGKAARKKLLDGMKRLKRDGLMSVKTSDSVAEGGKAA